MRSSPGSSSKGKVAHVKASWTPENHELFVDLCVEQITIGNRPRTYLNAEGWNNVVESFHTITGLRYDRVQMKNHWDFTKKHWIVWRKLVSTDKMKWDPDKRSFGASEQEWVEYIKDNLDAAQFRTMDIPFADKLDIIFGETADFGQAVECGHLRKNTNWSNGAETVCPRKRRNNSSVVENAEPIRKHQWSGDAVFPDGKPESNLEHCDAVESRSVVSVHSPPRKLCYSIEECIKLLDSMEELEQGSQLYLFALDIFLKKEYREIFLNLKKSSTRIAWLQRLQSVGLPLPLP